MRQVPREHRGLTAFATRPRARRYRCEEDKAKSDDELTAKVVRERDLLISSLADQLTPLLDADAPYALYGFSSGALFIYLLVTRARCTHA